MSRKAKVQAADNGHTNKAEAADKQLDAFTVHSESEEMNAGQRLMYSALSVPQH